MDSSAAVAEPTRHRLSAHHLAALAAGDGSAETISELLAAERSWRLLQLRAVLDAAAHRSDVVGPLPPVADAWRLLVTAERRSPAEVAQLLASPQVGTWAGYALRRLRRSSTERDAPLWVDVGYLHALAAAAAVRAGVDFTMAVPVRSGFVCLPTLGGAAVSTVERWAHVEVRGSDGAAAVVSADRLIEIGARGTRSGVWLTAPTLRATEGGLTLSVTLDHIDPYRNLRAPTEPDRLSAEQVSRWRELFEGAWALIVNACPQLAPSIARGLSTIVPQPAAERFRTMSASAGDAFGSTIISEPEDAPEMAVTIVHEFQHIKLGGLLHLAPLHHREPKQRLYAPWRDDPRPLGGLLQGVYAFVGITEFWRRFRSLATGAQGQLAHFEFARWRRQVETTLHMLSSLPELTAVGQRLLAGLLTTAARWTNEVVPAEIDAAARAAVVDHRARWRLHHLRPDPATVSTLAKAWIAGAEPPAVRDPQARVAPDASAHRLDSRAVLSLWRITDHDGFAGLLKDPAAVADRVSGATQADLAYVACDVDRSRALCIEELGIDLDRPGAWAGLGLVERAVGSRRAAGVLLAYPELVREVYREAGGAGDGSADPVALADWLGRVLPVG